ncbi:MAG: HEPN domain-containing protein [Myxococcota bacterium]|nr:HEPN domain-containing protein [Myxococcota bacterium]
MKKSTAHLPKRKRDELKYIVKVIREMAPAAEMIILFGSHARGDWVEDEYREGHITYKYISDFDILVITGSKKSAENGPLWNRVFDRVYDPNGTPINIIRHHIEDVNEKIAAHNFFFGDIKKEGILLYNSGNHKLARARKFSPEERRTKAARDFRIWFKMAREFFIDYEHAFKRRSYKKAAFELHQATEHAYHAVQLVFTGYKVKAHDIENLGKTAASFENEFLKIFPRKTKEEDRLFKLLRTAYIEARYDEKYRITRKELDYLAGRVKKLHTLTKKVCKQKIESFTAG